MVTVKALAYFKLLKVVLSLRLTVISKYSQFPIIYSREHVVFRLIVLKNLKVYMLSS